MNRHAHIHYILGAVVLLATTAACTDIDTPCSPEPRLEVQPATDVLRTQATLRATVGLRGKTEMPEVTFHYGRTRNLEESLEATAPPEGDTLKAHLTGLTAGATYYWCVTTYNGRVKLTSDTLTFTTEPNSLPHVTPVDMLSCGPTSMIVSLTVPDNGGEPLTGAGCYVREADTQESRKVVAASINESQQMTMRIGHLEPNRTYEVWGYAANTAGETLSDTLTYTTSSTYDITEPGQLAALMQADVCTLTELAFRGPLNGDDLCCLRRMMGRDSEGNDTGGQLARVDLTEAYIVAGGGPYDQGHFTQDRVVGTGLFAALDRLERVLLPASATRIETNAFEGCTGLRQIVIPASASEVGQSRGCTALDSIAVDAANSHYQSDHGVLLDAQGTSIVWFPMGKSGDYALPSTVRSIGDYAFRECHISRFTLPDGLREIGQGAFSHSLVEEVTLPDSLLSVPTGTFQGCERLTTVHLGSQLELVSDYAFDGCPLTDLYVKATLPPYCASQAFASASTAFTTTCVLHVPQGCKARYRSSQGWKDFTRIRETP